MVARNGKGGRPRGNDLGIPPLFLSVLPYAAAIWSLPALWFAVAGHCSWKLSKTTSASEYMLSRMRSASESDNCSVLSNALHLSAVSRGSRMNVQSGDTAAIVDPDCGIALFQQGRDCIRFSECSGALPSVNWHTVCWLMGYV